MPVIDLKPRVGVGDRLVPGCEKLNHAKENLPMDDVCKLTDYSSLFLVASSCQHK